MSKQKPEFHLVRIDDDAGTGPLEIYSIQDLPDTTCASRRGFLGVSLAAATAAKSFLLQEAPADVTRVVTRPPDKARRYAVIFAHEKSIRDLAFSSDSSRLFSLGGSGMIKEWELPHGSLVRSIPGDANCDVEVLKLIHGTSGDDFLALKKRDINSGQPNSHTATHVRLVRTSDFHEVQIIPNVISFESVAERSLLSVITRTKKEGKFKFHFELYSSPTQRNRAESASPPIMGWNVTETYLERTTASLSIDLPESIKYGRKIPSITSDGQYFLSLEDSNVTFGRTSDGTVLHKSSFSTGNSYCVSGRPSISADGHRVAFLTYPCNPRVSTEYDHVLEVLSLPDLSQVSTCRIPHAKWVAFSSNAERVVVAKTGEILIINTQDGSVMKRLNINAGTQYVTLKQHDYIAFNDYKDYQKRIIVLNASNGDIVATLEGHLESIESIVACPQERYMASGDNDGVIILWDLETWQMRGMLFDPKSSETDATTYSVASKLKSSSGSADTPDAGKSQENASAVYTMPAGKSLPAGATCTCNCVAGLRTTGKDRPRKTTQTTTGSSRSASSGFQRSMSGGRICSCNKICVCIPVCQALRLNDCDSVVRVMAEQIMLLMGIQEMPYFAWAIRRSTPLLRPRIKAVVKSIETGVVARTEVWPSLGTLQKYLWHSDEVVAIMAAQLIQFLPRVLSQSDQNRQNHLLAAAAERPWYIRYQGQDW